jgi:phosphatidylglycerophosphate synthase
MDPRGAASERSPEPFLTLPNLLTLSRIPLGALIWLQPEHPAFVLGIMAIGGLTDVLDGWVERRRHPGRTTESRGAWLDPLCDKLFILSVLLAVCVAHDVPLWLVPLIALREILQTLLAVAVRLRPAFRKRLRFRFGAHALGKATTVAQVLTIAAILLGSPLQLPLAFLTAGLALAAVAVYVRRALATLRT